MIVSPATTTSHWFSVGMSVRASAAGLILLQVINIQAVIQEERLITRAERWCMGGPPSLSTRLMTSISSRS